MKITLEKKTIKKALAIFTKQNVGAYMPTISFQIKDNEFIIWSKTRTNCSVFKVANCEENNTDIFTIGFKQFKEIVKNLGNVFYFNGEIFHDDNISQYFTRLENDNQTIAAIDFQKSTTVDTEKLIFACKESVRVLSKNSDRSYGSVSYFDFKDNLLSIAATDGFRLCLSEIIKVDTLEHNFCVGYVSNEILTKLNKKAETILKINSDKTMLGVFNDGNIFYIRLSDVEYPRYNAVMPTTSCILSMPSLAFKASLASVLSNNCQDKTKLVTLDYKDSILTISAGEYSETIKDKKMYGEYLPPQFKIHANGNFILDCFKNTKEDEFQIRWNMNDLEQAFEIVTNDFNRNIIVPMKSGGK